MWGPRQEGVRNRTSVASGNKVRGVPVSFPRGEALSSVGYGTVARLKRSGSRVGVVGAFARGLGCRSHGMCWVHVPGIGLGAQRARRGA